MATVNLELPADLVSAAKLDQGNVSQEAAKLITLELFREGTVSLGRAAELCATLWLRSWILPRFTAFPHSTMAVSNWKKTGVLWRKSARDGLRGQSYADS
jgi:hypothetical protein